jgi:predicted phage-related endonuclease
VIGQQKCTPFDGTLEAYRECLLSDNGNQWSKSSKARKSSQNEAATKQRIKKMSALEKSIAIAETKKKELETKLSTAYDAALHESYTNCCRELEKMENEWLELSV